MKKQLHFVFRKPNAGNYSIENIYNAVYEELLDNEDSPFVISKTVLTHTYDFKAFFKAFFGFLFFKKRIVHITGGNAYMAFSYPFMTRIVTIHDIYHFHNMKGIKGKLYNLCYVYLPLKISHKIIVVSENTKQDILDNFNINSSKIQVLDNPLVISKDQVSMDKGRSILRSNPLHILQIGDKPLKNYKRLLEATKNMNVFYNFVHANPKNINALISEFKMEEKAKVHVAISNDELYKLYNENDVLFFASEAEGFGLPILEAQLFDMPVITSNIPPMNLVGEGTILVDPLSVDSIAEGFEKLYDTDLMNTNSVLSKKNVSKYNISTITENYIKFYKSLI